MTTPDEYRRARRDTAFRERVARAYAGSFDVLDALWWREHPDTPTPDGTPPPGTARAHLQRIAFAPTVAEDDGADSVDAALQADRAADELHRLDALLAAERRAIDEAVAAAVAAAAEAAVAAETSEAAETSGAAAQTGQLGAPSGSADTPAAPHRRRPRRLLLVTAGIVLALLGSAGGFLIAQTTSGANAGGGDFADASSALAIFDRPPQPADQPERLYAVQLREDTLRTLSMPEAPLYVALDIDGNACLVLVQENGTYSANCVPPDRFPATGLLIRGSITVTGRPSQGDPLPQSFVDVEASWLPDGSTVWGPNPATRGNR